MASHKLITERRCIKPYIASDSILVILKEYSEESGKITMYKGIIRWKLKCFTRTFKCVINYKKLNT